MQHEIKPLELLFLWRLAAAADGKDWLKDVKPDPGAPARKRLSASGLIAQAQAVPPGGRARATRLELTDAGWAYLGDHLDADLNTKSTAGAEVLARLLGRIRGYLGRKQLSIGELLGEDDEHLVEPPPPDNPKAQVTTAYYELSGGRRNVRVRLADLRRRLETVSRSALDAALFELALSGEASLFRLDNPAEIGPEDREAVLRTPTGEERHIIFLGGNGS